MTKLSHVILLSAALTQPSSANDLSIQDKAVRSAASAFLSALRSDAIPGLPSEEQLQRLSPHLTPSLSNAIQQARRLQDREIHRAPHEKPSWADGDLFSSLSEGVTKWQITDMSLPSPQDAYVHVTQTYAEKGLEDAVWQDTYCFKKAGDTWLLDDMVMEGEWSLGGSLRKNLPGGLTEDASHVSPDERWRLDFGMEGDAVATITLQASDKSSPPIVIEKRMGDDCLSFNTFAIWSPLSTAVAIRLGEGPAQSSTKIYVLQEQKWQPVKLPEFFRSQRMTAMNNGFKEDTTVTDPIYWENDQTLVLLGVRTWSKAGEGDGISHRISVKVHHDREAEILNSVDTP